MKCECFYLHTIPLYSTLIYYTFLYTTQVIQIESSERRRRESFDETIAASTTSHGTVAPTATAAPPLSSDSITLGGDPTSHPNALSAAINLTFGSLFSAFSTNPPSTSTTSSSAPTAGTSGATTLPPRPEAGLSSLSAATRNENASFLASLPPDLRQDALLSADAAFLATLPLAVQAEARVLREANGIGASGIRAGNRGGTLLAYFLSLT